MADNRLSRMSRKELLEMLLEQSRLLDSREKEIKRLNALLEERRVTAEKAGSIAEAALQLSGIFEAAQKAADIYLESIGAPTGGGSAGEGADAEKEKEEKEGKG